MLPSVQPLQLSSPTSFAPEASKSTTGDRDQRNLNYRKKCLRLMFTLPKLSRLQSADFWSKVLPSRKGNNFFVLLSITRN
jgi:hypothetical protein